MSFRLGYSKCPICDARLEPWQFKVVHLWAWKRTFRCQSCATMLRWTGQTNMKPLVAIWALFFSPPVLAQVYYGSWTSPEYPLGFLITSWAIGAIFQFAIMLFLPWGAVKCSDE